MGEEEEWVEAAMVDDGVVAELLVRLNQFDATAKTAAAVVVPLEWGLRQPRSRQVQQRCSMVVQSKKEGESARASPTTPLSWSGSGGAGGGAAGLGDLYEECSRQPKPPPLAAFRSKGAGGNEASSNRRTRKKKTFAELKEEECLLLKESVYLKKEVAKLQAVWEEERVRNNTLKRMKLESQLHSSKQTSTSDFTEQTTCDPLCHSNTNQNATIMPTSASVCRGPDAAACPTPHLSNTSEASNVPKTHKSSEVSGIAATQKSFVVLPDLNLPLEEDYVLEDLYGMS